MSSPRAPDSAALTLVREISQEIARPRAADLRFGQKKNVRA
jgi:hypothetical protein